MKTIKYDNLYLKDFFILLSKDEKKNIDKYDICIDDYYYQEKSFELSEIKMQKAVIQNIIKRNNMTDKNIDALISGDLNSQITASSYAAKYFDIPFLGIYAACSSFIESIILGSLLLKTKDAQNVITCTSSHALTSERQFRYPIEYGHSRPMSSTVTATGAVSTIISNEKSNIKLISSTIGKVVDMGIKDVNNMGAVMAPACATTLYYHLKNMNKKINDYDLILTGDLGKLGIDILKDYYYLVYHEELSNIMDAGDILYNNVKDKYSGGSGPCCLPLVFFGKIIPNKKHHKILLLGTGAMHSTVLVNQKIAIPSVCHALELEV